MPCPPPETPVAATVLGRLTVGGGNGWLEIWLVGTGCTEPVLSAGAELRDANGLEFGLLKRDVSALQPVKPTARTPITASRDQRRGLGLVTERIGLTHCYATGTSRSEPIRSKDCFKQETPR
jgi:hypothetical protein